MANDRKKPDGVETDDGRRPADGAQHKDAAHAAPTRPRPELSDYEDLQRRSRDLQRDHETGGPGTAQAPDDATPLLHPKPPAPKTDADQ
jgi:hypothetical protein